MKLEFILCGSPTDAFWSQTAMFRYALDTLGGPYRSARLVLCLGGQEVWLSGAQPIRHLPEHWARWFKAIELYWAESREDEAHMVYRATTLSADVSMVCDADTLPLTPFPVEFLEKCVHEPAIRAVIAHYPPPMQQDDPGRATMTHAEMWKALSDRILGRPIPMLQPYTLLNNPDVLCPFYINHGFIAATPQLMRKFGKEQEEVFAEVDAIINNDFTHQIAVSVAVERGGLPHEALPMRFNFPNDPICDRLYPEELQNVILMHYLRIQHLDRHLIFTREEAFDRFMNAPLEGSNEVFRARIRTMTGGSYPFSAR